MSSDVLEATKYWLALSSIKSVGARKIQKLVEKFGSPEAIFSAPVIELADQLKSYALACEIIQSVKELTKFEKIINQITKSGIDIICPDSPEYPYLLRFIKDPPPILFKKGVMPDNNYITVAIVGTRFPSDGGARFAREMAGKLAQRDVVIVSGLAQGIDTSAHVGVLNAKGRTLGVLGSGLHKIYPPENVQLALRICRKGAILSECHPNEIVSKGKLIQRNRITSGISQGVILVEPERGAKNTANWASKQKKPVFIYDPENKSETLALPANCLAIRGLDGIDVILDKLGTVEIFSLSTDSSDQAFLF